MSKVVKAIFLCLVIGVISVIAVMNVQSESVIAQDAEVETVADTEIVDEGSSELEAVAEDTGYATLEEFQASPAYVKFIIDNLWVLIAAFMVLLMHLGFTTVESGLTQSKNAVNVIYKNIFILCTGILIYAFNGFQLMYPGDFNGYVGFGGFGIGFDSSDIVGMFTPSQKVLAFL